MASNFKVKIGKIGLITFIRHLGISKRSGISRFRFQWFIFDDLATSCKILWTWSINPGV